MPNLFALPNRPDPSTIVPSPSLDNGNFQNDGNIWASSPDSNVVTALYGNNSGSVTNNGLIVSEAPVGNAFGIWVTSHMVPPLVNNGSIFAIAAGNASAISLWEPSAVVRNIGTIAAFAPTGNIAGVGSAVAVGMYNGGYLENSVGAAILAEGLYATAVVMSRGPTIDPLHPQVVNAGRIEAYSLDPAHPSVAIMTGHLSLEFLAVVNSGLIRADIAYRSDAQYYSPPQHSRDQISNLAGGQIYGEIFTDLGDDQIFNAGFMSGTIHFGAGSDLYDGTNGSRIGVVYGEAGNDVLRGGNGVEHFDGGDGDDYLTGGLSADRLISGSGSDTFIDTAAGLNGDTIDFSAGDRIIIRDVALAGFSASVSGLTLNYTGGSVTLTQAYTGPLTVSAAAGGGVQISMQAAAPFQDVRNDFNGDGRSDVLFRHWDGRLFELIGTPSGGWAINPIGDYNYAPRDWRIFGTGDFNGDGRDDILWRSQGGTVSNWLATPDGSFIPNDANAMVAVPTSWTIEGTGDFNGDGRDDILWRNSDGTISNWLGTANGGFVINDSNAAVQVSNDWQVAAIGDFNGDGRDDILWRSNTHVISNWLANANGGFTANDGNAMATVSVNWTVIGVGDFNGDGRDDILWQGYLNAFETVVTNWLSNGQGGFSVNDANALRAKSVWWDVVGVGDYNGDGRDDIMWRTITGEISNWLSTDTGGTVINDEHALSNEPYNWRPFHWDWI